MNFSCPAFSQATLRRVSRLARRRYWTAPDVRINGHRLEWTIHETSVWGQGHRYGRNANDTGMSRLALSAGDKQVRDWLAEQATHLACDVKVDQMGNMFAVRAGKKPGLPTFMGSHLDTQPAGGRYDGVLGVLAALEGLRTLHDHGIQTEYPIGIVNWTNEEGARFPKSILASGVWAGDIKLEDAWALKEVGGGGRTVRQELEAIGYLGEHACSWDEAAGGVGMAAHFELHIEQGPILEDLGGRNIGVVQGVQAYRWYTVNVTGAECHTGTTPLEKRADALLAASKMIVASNELARTHPGLASTGILSLSPGSTNTVPGSVSFSLDLRHPHDSELALLEDACKATFAHIAAEAPRPCAVEITLDTNSPAVTFDKTCIAAVQDAAEHIVGSWKCVPIVSGAGHDSVMTARRCPTSMVFIPCRGGVSHNPAEFSDPRDCAIGAQVLLGAALRFDALRTS